MLEISYENDDPYIVYNTLIILNDEFVKQYRDLRFGETNNVIAYFESELERVGNNLRNLEDSLRDYNVQHRVINYDEQTKHIAALSRDYELRYEEILLNFESAEKLRARSRGSSKGCRRLSATTPSSSRNSIRSGASIRACRPPRPSSPKPTARKVFPTGRPCPPAATTRGSYAGN